MAFPVPVVCVLASLLGVTSGHAWLTFPVARDYPLDFLTNTRVPQPCGMPKGDVASTLEAGSTFNVTWQMTVGGHQGGFVIEILEGDEIKHTLTGDPEDFKGTENTKMQWYQVTLPSAYTCQSCTVRLRRQALENGADYQFLSCADVTIQSPDNFDGFCSDHGMLQPDGSCECERLYSGDNCQYENDCDADSDCNGGTCLQVAKNYMYNPGKQCFCKPGKMGRQCFQVSKVTTWGDHKYQRKQVAEGFEIEWRLIQDEGEIEFVVTAESSTWVGLGWKPTDIPDSCRNLTLPDGVSMAIYTDVMAPMDCTDMVIGTADGNSYRILDYYTRDRGTPREDRLYGGEFSLTAALGKEEGGRTTLLFRKQLQGDDPWDHAIEDKLYTVIWARGQEPGGDDFYEKDVLKKHKKNSQSRGVATINLVDAASPPRPCKGRWANGCDDNGEDCGYKVEWAYQEASDTIKFDVMMKTSQSENFWTGIGFAPEPQMMNADTIMGWINEAGDAVVYDWWIGDRFSVPVKDDKQDLSDTKVEYTNGVLSLTFTRPSDTGDVTQDVAFTQAQCYHFLFPWSGGEVEDDDVRRHTNTPAISGEKICIHTCDTTSAAAPVTNKLLTQILLTLTGLLAWIFIIKK